MPMARVSDADCELLHPVPVPPPAAASTATVALPGARLWYWDTGGDGPPVVLMHPASGSALIWGYQQPALAAAGYRVIAYSRRGHYGSDPVAASDPGCASEDLRGLLDHLGIDRCHVVASAAGVSVTLDFALSDPSRVAGFVWSCGIGGITDESYVRMLEALRPDGFARMPMTFQELGPSYRFANPDGVAAWQALEHQAHGGNFRGQRPANTATMAALGGLDVPTLLMTGDADLWWPPAALRAVASHLPRRETLVVAEAGHSLYWERPAVFNRAVLDFLARNP